MRAADFENEAETDWNAFDGSPGAFHDLAVASVSLLATATIGDWDPRRFRANVLLDMGPTETEVDWWVATWPSVRSGSRYAGGSEGAS